MRKRSRIPDLDVVWTTTNSRLECKSIDAIHFFSQIHFVDESPLLQKSLHSTNTNDSFDDDELNINIKIKWEGTSKVEKVAFGMVSFNTDSASTDCLEMFFFLSFLVQNFQRIDRPAE